MNQVYQEIGRHIPNLRRYALALTRNPVTAEDLLQESLTRALMKSHLFQTGTNLRGWLFSIMHNVHICEARRQGRVRSFIHANRVAADATVPPAQDWSLVVKALDRALQVLPHEQRILILLAGMECMSYGEIVATLDLPVGTVKSRISRGRATLRLAIERSWHHEAAGVPAPEMPPHPRDAPSPDARLREAGACAPGK